MGAPPQVRIRQRGETEGEGIFRLADFYQSLVIGLTPNYLTWQIPALNIKDNQQWDILAASPSAINQLEDMVARFE